VRHGNTDKTERQNGSEGERRRRRRRRRRRSLGERALDPDWEERQREVLWVQQKSEGEEQEQEQEQEQVQSRPLSSKEKVTRGQLYSGDWDRPRRWPPHWLASSLRRELALRERKAALGEGH
jgi:hypothetical protein